MLIIHIKQRPQFLWRLLAVSLCIEKRLLLDMNTTETNMACGRLKGRVSLIEIAHNASARGNNQLFFVCEFHWKLNEPKHCFWSACSFTPSSIDAVTVCAQSLPPNKTENRFHVKLLMCCQIIGWLTPAVGFIVIIFIQVRFKAFN